VSSGVRGRLLLDFINLLIGRGRARRPPVLDAYITLLRAAAQRRGAPAPALRPFRAPPCR